MIHLPSHALCTGCTACKSVCPQEAITMEPDEDGFLYPKVDKALCVECHACEKVCPVLHPGDLDLNPECYAARTQDKTLLMKSSSGGIFTELAYSVLAMRGVVFGCVWQRPSMRAIHSKVADEAGLEQMRGSKYVQSDLQNTFREVKSQLLTGRAVLFSGTPCQIAGLNHFLGEDFPNLLTVEVICHGVGAPKVFEQHLREMVQRYRSPIKDYFFRCKRGKSWYNYSINISFTNGREYLCHHDQDAYFRSFNEGLSLRDSCFNCSAKSGRSSADITIGDFWHIEEVSSRFCDDLGVNAVLIHTEKGKELWEKTPAAYERVREKDIVKRVPSYCESMIRSRKRNAFLQNYRRKNLGRYVPYLIGGPSWFRNWRKAAGKLLRFAGLRK